MSVGVVTRQTGKGQPSFRKRNPNPIHAARAITRALPDGSLFVVYRTICGVRAHRFARDKDGNLVPEWDPKHPQACGRCRALLSVEPAHPLAGFDS